MSVPRKYKSNLVIVNKKSNFKSHLTRCQLIIDNVDFDEVVLRAIGKATHRAEHLAEQLNQNNYRTFEIEKSPFLVDLIDDKSKRPIQGAEQDLFSPDTPNVEIKKITKVPGVEIRVKKSKLELARSKGLKNLENLPKPGEKRKRT